MRLREEEKRPELKESRWLNPRWLIPISLNLRRLSTESLLMLESKSSLSMPSRFTTLTLLFPALNLPSRLTVETGMTPSPSEDMIGVKRFFSAPEDGVTSDLKSMGVNWISGLNVLTIALSPFLIPSALLHPSGVRMG